MDEMKGGEKKEKPHAVKGTASLLRIKHYSEMDSKSRCILHCKYYRNCPTRSAHGPIGK